MLIYLDFHFIAIIVWGGVKTKEKERTDKQRGEREKKRIRKYKKEGATANISSVRGKGFWSSVDIWMV